MLDTIIMSITSVGTILGVLLAWHNRPRRPKFKLECTPMPSHKGSRFIEGALRLHVSGTKATKVVVTLPNSPKHRLVNTAGLEYLDNNPISTESFDQVDSTQQLSGNLWDRSKYLKGKYLTFPVKVTCNELGLPVTFTAKFPLKDIEWLE